MIEDDVHHLLFGVRRSARYHNRRRHFYERFNMWVNAVAMILGSATVYGVLQHPGNTTIAIVAGFVVTVLSAFNLVIGSTEKARLHSDLSKSFIQLEKQIVAVEQPDQAHLTGWTQLRLDIEVDEPPVLRVLDTICHNELTRAMGYDKDKLVKIGYFQRLFAPVVDFGEHRLG